MAAVFFVIFAGFMIFEDAKIFQKKQELVLKINDYKKQIEDIQKSNQELNKEIANSDNPDYIEKIAYEQLDQQRPGEKEFIFSMPDNKSQNQNGQQNNSLAGWLSGAWSWIKSKF